MKENFNQWCDQVNDMFTDEFWWNYIYRIESKEYAELYDKLFNDGKTPQEAADIITKKLQP